MIFASVGTQLPFPRLVSALDRIAGKHNLEVFAQTCDPSVCVSHIQAVPFIDPVAFDSLVARADRIIGHSGIGTILSARRYRKPLIVFPRLASLGEHRNEHQLATVRSLADRLGIHVAYNDDDLEHFLTCPTLAPVTSEESRARTALIGRLREFIAA